VRALPARSYGTGLLAEQRRLLAEEHRLRTEVSRLRTEVSGDALERCQRSPERVGAFRRTIGAKGGRKAGERGTAAGGVVATYRWVAGGWPVGGRWVAGGWPVGGWTSP
jgi:hypothetical protein